ncbi:hypothetical protein ABZ832_12395 [Streptantibioticus parmotrematis]|uniref:hypothetical protein n=1 Tax=Streptantibioticus parmotrematis TaxID=2873249 RepID=UPI0033F015C5
MEPRIGVLGPAREDAVASDFQLFLGVEEHAVGSGQPRPRLEGGVAVGVLKSSRARVQSAAAATSSASCGNAPTSVLVTSSRIPATSGEGAVSVSLTTMPGSE